MSWTGLAHQLDTGHDPVGSGHRRRRDCSYDWFAIGPDAVPLWTAHLTAALVGTLVTQGQVPAGQQAECVQLLIGGFAGTVDDLTTVLGVLQ